MFSAPPCCSALIRDPKANSTISTTGRQLLTTPRAAKFDSAISIKLDELKKAMVRMHEQAVKECEEALWQEIQRLRQASIQSAEVTNGSPFLPDCERCDAEVQTGIDLDLQSTRESLPFAHRNDMKRMTISRTKIEDVIGVENPEGSHHMKKLLMHVPSYHLQNLPLPDHRRGLAHVLKKIDANMCVRIFMNIVVVTNIIVLGFQCDIDWDGWIYVDLMYTTCFVLEVVFRIYKGGVLIFCPGHYDWCWRIYDFVLAIVATFETTAGLLSWFEGNDARGFITLRVLRLLRITRIMHVTRLIVFRDLILMVNGIMGGIRTLCWSTFIILIPIYTFALFLTETIGKKQNQAPGVVDTHFRTMPKAMFTTFRCLVLDDCSAVDGTPLFEKVVRSHGWFFGALYAFFYIVVSFGIFNVIVAIYVESTMAIAKSNDDMVRKRRLEDQERLATKTYRLLHLFWCNFTGKSFDEPFDVADALKMQITEEFFMKTVLDPNVRRLFAELDVPDDDFLDMFEMCNADNDGILTLDELVEGIKRLRGEPRRSDMVFIQLMLKEVRNRVQVVDKRIQHLNLQCRGPNE